MPNPVTLKRIARQTNLSLAAVSYALRGSSKVSAATVERVREAARLLGYRPNFRVTELMTHIRAARTSRRGDTLALVFIEGRSGDTDDFVRSITEGAKSRATLRGLAMESFFLEELADSARRLAGILRARGVAGVVFAPVQKRARVDLDWPWDEFPFSVVGMAEWNQPVSRAGHHHFEAMRRALRQWEESGGGPAACWVDRASDERAHRGWSAAWLASEVSGAARRIRRSDATETLAFRKDWLTRLKPDCLVVSHFDELCLLREAGWKGGVERTLLLDWRPGCGAAGVDQGYDTIAASAVDLVVEQLYHNERGLPDPPRMLLFPGRWRSGEAAEPAGAGHEKK
jgi:LacI family transcriptional regulator